MNSIKRRLMSAVAVSAFLAVVFTGCVLDDQKALQNEIVEPTVMTKGAAKPVNVVKSEQEQNLVLKTFENMVYLNKPLDRVMAFVDDNIKQLSKEKAASLILDLETYQKKCLTQYQIESSGTDLKTLFDANGLVLQTSVAALPKGKVKDLLLHLDSSGLKIQHRHDGFEPVIDYECLQSRYAEFVSVATQDYLNIRSLESEKPCFNNRSLVITWQELLDRMQRCEEFILVYPNFERIETIKVMYYRYFKAFMYGGEGTPVFSAEDGHILDDVVVVYQNMKMNARNTISMKYLKTYFNVVQKNKFKYAKQVDSVRQQITKALMAELKLTSNSFKDPYLSVE